jgi:hypothetical protein
MAEPISFRTTPDAALAAYREQGFFIEPPGLWSNAQIDELVRAAAELPTSRDGSFAPCMHPHRISEAFLRALRNPNIVVVMEKLLGGPVSGIQTELFFCAPGTHGFARHQDNHYVEAGQDAFASAWTALEDVTVQSGALILWPGTAPRADPADRAAAGARGRRGTGSERQQATGGRAAAVQVARRARCRVARWCSCTDTRCTRRTTIARITSAARC